MAQAGGYTPLHQAAAAGLVEVVKILLEAGAKSDLRCDQGKTPADYARERRHDGVLQVLGKETAVLPSSIFQIPRPAGTGRIDKGLNGYLRSTFVNRIVRSALKHHPTLVYS